MKENPTYRKAMSFAIRIVNVYKYLVEEKTERVMSKQLLRSGTSIGANFCESLSAESDLDFISTMSEETFIARSLQRNEPYDDKHRMCRNIFRTCILVDISNMLYYTTNSIDGITFKSVHRSASVQDKYQFCQIFSFFIFITSVCFVFSPYN